MSITVAEDARIATEDDLEELESAGRASLYPDHTKVLVGMSSCGKAAGADDVYETLTESLSERDDVEVGKTGCMGFCDREPLVEVIDPGGESVIYENVSEADADAIAGAIESGRDPAVDALAARTHEDADHEGDVPHIDEVPFYGAQERVVLGNSGLVDPESLEEYVARGGFVALHEAVTESTPATVIQTIKESNLRGRGGGGFPTGLKWEFIADNDADQKYLICNADEGDPGAYMDRTLLESDPFAVLE
ncbi:MAG TPA: hypothetical protein VJ898_08535, partial [Natrialbaceae archaeon]|nr:hypothetical protein [Natrialbaceae archaeon]